MIVDTTGVVGTEVLSQLASGGYLMLVGLRDGISSFNPKEVVDRSLKIIGSIDSLGTFSTAHYLIEQQIIPAKKSLPTRIRWMTTMKPLRRLDAISASGHFSPRLRRSRLCCNLVAPTTKFSY